MITSLNKYYRLRVYNICLYNPSHVTSLLCLACCWVNNGGATHSVY